jgi:predicted TIM-barrel fold metal-dependent hydrolase
MVLALMIIDAHTHLWEAKHLSPEVLEDWHRKGIFHYDNVSLEDLINDMDEAGVDKAVVVASSRARVWQQKESLNKYVASMIKKYPDRLIGFAGAAPLTIKNRVNWTSLNEFEIFVTEHGMSGMFLAPIYDHYRPDDKAAYIFYDKALELGVPVLFHQAATLTFGYPMEYGRPIHLDDPVQDFPDLKFIVAHMGYPWTEELIVMMRKLPNLYADISASILYRPSILTWTLVLAKEYKVLDRILWGTDYPVSKPKPYIEWLIEKYNPLAEKKGYPTLTKDEIDGILGNNAQKLLQIS